MPWLKKFVSIFELPPLELTSEREKELIEKIVQEVSKWRMEIPALLIGWALLPFTSIYSNIFLMPLSPFLEGLGINGHEIAIFFKKRENVAALVKRIEERLEAGEKGASGL